MSSDFISTQWGKIWYEWNGEKGLDDTNPLLVLHGGPGFPHDYLTPLRALSASRPVIFYDQLGCGNSDRPNDPSLWTLEHYLAELEAVVASLELPRFHLLGHSWGAILAAEYALKHPKRVATVTLASPALSLTRWQADMIEYEKALPPLVQTAIQEARISGNFHSSAFQAATQVFYRHHVCRLYPLPTVYVQAAAKMGKPVYQTMWGPTEFICTGNLVAYDCCARLPQLNMPTLLTCGRYDEAAPTTVSYYQSLIPQAKMAVFEFSAHLPHLEEREKFLEVMEEFLQGEGSLRTPD